MALYTVVAPRSGPTPPLILSEQYIYGSSRLGVRRLRQNMDSLRAYPVNANLIGQTYLYQEQRGEKFFELSNHLGNVLVTVSDRKYGVDQNSDGIYDYYTADVASANDYYPFGMQMPGRKYAGASSYRYGFNGKENDNEVKGEGNEQDYGMRVYDPRVGKFLSVDPLTRDYPFYSPYQFAGNMPIRAIDLDGLEITFKKVWNNEATLVDWLSEKAENGMRWVNENINPLYIGYQHGWEIYNAKDFNTGLPKSRIDAVSATGVDAVMWMAGEKAFTSLARTGNVLEQQMIKTSTVMGQTEKTMVQKEAQNSTNSEIKSTVTQSTRLPVSNGSWTGVPGNSLWKSTLSEVNSVTGGKGIQFVDGRPNFSPWAKGNFTIEGLTGNNAKDFALVYKKMVKDWGFKTQKAAADWLKANKLTIHHESGNVMQLVPSDLHNNIPHVGSASLLRKQ